MAWVRLHDEIKDANIALPLAMPWFGSNITSSVHLWQVPTVVLRIRP
jgi:hypothetical protein